MRFDAALSYLVLSTAALASPASAAEYKEADNARPTRKRTLRATAAEAEAEVVSALRAPADAPVAATAIGDKAAVMTPQEEEDVRLLRLDDAYYWKKFLDGDKSMPDGCNFDVSCGLSYYLRFVFASAIAACRMMMILTYFLPCLHFVPSTPSSGRSRLRAQVRRRQSVPRLRRCLRLHQRHYRAEVPVPRRWLRRGRCHQRPQVRVQDLQRWS